MSQERQFPSGPLPGDVEQAITDIISDVGLGITEKVLRRRLEMKYEIEFSSHAEEVKSLVKNVLKRPQFQKELARVRKEKEEGPIGGKGRKRSRNSPPKHKEKEKKPDDYPKAALSAYLLFGNSVREQIRSENPDIKITEVAKKISEKWAALSEEGKAKYKSLAEADKMRFEREMAAYKDRGGKEIKRSSKKDSKRAKKDPNAPKRASSAYLFFASDFRKKNPTLSVVECMRNAGSAWKELTEKDKKPFEEMAEKDKERYTKECAEQGTGKGKSKQEKVAESSSGSSSDDSGSDSE